MGSGVALRELDQGRPVGVGEPGGQDEVDCHGLAGSVRT